MEQNFGFNYLMLFSVLSWFHSDFVIIVKHCVFYLFCVLLFVSSWLKLGSNLGVYLGVRTCELFLCFVAIVRVYYFDFFVFFVLRHL